MSGQTPKRECKRCGRPIRQSDLPNIKYCSELCSRPTVEDFERAKRERGPEGRPK